MITKIARITIPTPTQALFSMLASIILLGVIFRNHLVAWLTGSSGISSGQLQSSYKGELTKLTHIGFMPDLTIGLFWAAVGVVGYVAVVELVNVFISARNELVVNATFANLGPFSQRLVRPLVRLAIAVGFLIYIVVGLRVLLPLWTDLAGRLLLGRIDSGAIESAVGGLVGLAATLYGGWLLGVVLRNFR